MFEQKLEFNEELISAINQGKCTPPAGYKLVDDKLVQKSEEEILADDWNCSIERRCEYIDYLNTEIARMRKYLSETDWYVSRKAETNKAMPEDVLATRTEYREKISDFRKRLKEISEENI